MASPTLPSPAASPLRPARADALVQRWRVVHEAALLVAGLAGDFSAAATLETGTCPDSVRNAAGWRRALLSDGLADTAAILEGGIRALLAARAARAPTEAAARALWDEFLAARGALLALAGSVPVAALPALPATQAMGLPSS